MKYRIAVWGCAGFLVAGCWAVYGLAMPAMPFTQPEIMILVRVTCPITILSFYPLSLYWVLLANAVTYGMIGLMVETLRAKPNHAKPSQAG